jgi:toxin ParE1/3/4
VLADLDELATFIQKDSPQAAVRFLEAAQETFELLARTPELGEILPVGNPHLSGVRVWQVKGFENILVFYRPMEPGVEVIRVLHGARDLAAIFREED